MKDYSNLKLEFFIGATKRDLGGAREKLIDSVLEAKHIPSGMELWSAGVDPLLIDIANHLKQCDVHIIVLGARYGEYIEGEKRSFTEWEYRQSDGKRPILAFVLKEKEFKNERKKVISKDPREKEKEDDLIRFRKELMASRFCKFFSNTEAGIEELGRLCVNSINRLINAKSVGENAGWIKASSLEVSTLRQIRENKFLERELNRMREFSVLSERVVVDTVSKEKQAQTFWETMKGRIRRHEYKNLFFESGSTLAYVSDQFENLVLKSGSEDESWRIWTNNVLTLLQLLLYTDVDVRRFPPSAPDPEDKYGAIFPREWRSLKEPPSSEPRSLHPNEAAAVDKMRKKLRRFGEKVLFLATTSGWDLDHHLNDFRGPHVGSHPNMLFKRALFTCRHPVVIFLNAEKLGDPFEVGKCYPIFGPDIPLDEALKKFPLAFCVGYAQNITSPTRREGLEPKDRKERNDPRRITEVLNKINFNIIYTAPASGDTGAIIAGNQAFKKLVPND
jgi:hypothetical protein